MPPLAVAVSDNRLHQVEAFFRHLLGIHVGEFPFNFQGLAAPCRCRAAISSVFRSYSSPQRSSWS